MPADNTLPERSPLHSNAADPYPCSKRAKPAESEWSIKFGYCRTSLDMLGGYMDKRCPADCPNKAPIDVARGYDYLSKLPTMGVAGAAAWVCEQRDAREAAARAQGAPRAAG